MTSAVTKLCICVFALQLLIRVSAAQENSSANSAKPSVVYEDYHDTSAPLRDSIWITPSAEDGQQKQLRQVPRPTVTLQQPTATSTKSLAPIISPHVSTTGLFTFEGIANSSTTGGFFPPSPVVAVGSTQVVQSVNVSFEVFTKAGTPIFGPVPITATPWLTTTRWRTVG
jgi:hypothetical protein